MEPVHGVQLHQGHPQLDVACGEPAVDEVLLPRQVPLQPAQRVQQPTELSGPLGGFGVGASGALCGVLDALGAEPFDGFDLALRAARIQGVAAVAGEAVQVAQDVRGVGADDASGPVVAEHRREGRSGVVVGARLVERAQGGVAAAGTVRDGGQEGDRTAVVEAEEAVTDGEAQSVGTGGGQMEPVAVRHGVVAAARVAADPAPEAWGGGVGGRDGGERSDGHESPRGRARAVRGGSVVGGWVRRAGPARRPGRGGSAERLRASWARRAGAAQRRGLIALQTRSRSMCRREVRRGARNGVRPARPVTVLSRTMFPYPFTRIPSLECRSGTVRRQEGVHAWDSGRVTRPASGSPQAGRHVT